MTGFSYVQADDLCKELVKLRESTERIATALEGLNSLANWAAQKAATEEKAAKWPQGFTDHTVQVDGRESAEPAVDRGGVGPSSTGEG